MAKVLTCDSVWDRSSERNSSGSSTGGSTSGSSSSGSESEDDASTSNLPIAQNACKSNNLTSPSSANAFFQSGVSFICCLNAFFSMFDFSWKRRRILCDFSAWSDTPVTLPEIQSRRGVSLDLDLIPSFTHVNLEKCPKQKFWLTVFRCISTFL